MRLVPAIAAVVACLFSTAADASHLTPPVLPLVVRNPYLSTWLQSAREEPWKEWPMFWTGEHVGFSIMAGVPGTKTVYPLLGRPQDSLSVDDEGYNVSTPLYLGSQYDASTTNLSYILTDPGNNKDGKAEILVSFLSPITPTSTFRQSIPASYLNIYVTGDIDVDIYVDLNGQWVSADRGSKIVWDLHHTSLDGSSLALKTWSYRREVEAQFTEIKDQAEWGTLYFSAPSDARHESGVSGDLRQRFSRTGTLQNHNDPNFRGVMDEEPVFAFAKSFKANETSSGKSQSVQFTIAHVQDPIIQFAAARGLTLMQPLWKSYISKIEDLLAFHYLDFSAANSLAGQYTERLEKDAAKPGADGYHDLLALGARQVMGACHFVGSPEDPLLFLKEISSDGNTQTIDVIFPAAPFFLYTNPRWLAYMLEPDIEHMLSGQYPNKYAMHDLGAHYPNATGYPDGRDEYMPVEECGNILIMGLAVANSIRYNTNTSVESDWRAMSKSPMLAAPENKFFPLTIGKENGISYIDDAWIGGPQSLKQAAKWVSHSYSLWTQWTQYLIEYSLEPENQLSTDDFAGWLALQTNLALKGIIGIKAMAGLAEIVGNKDDIKKYNNISEVYITKWEEYGISRDKTHAKLSYDWFGSWTTIYNLYADSLLCFHLDKKSAASAQLIAGEQQSLHVSKDDSAGFVPRHIYQMASDWSYLVRQKYSVPLDSRHLYAKNDWVVWAMSVAAPKVRNKVLGSLALWVNETSTNRPLTDLHETEGSGGFPGPDFFARPVVGGHFAYLALSKACGGRALGGLEFLNDDITKQTRADTASKLLQRELDENASHVLLPPYADDEL